MKDKLPPLRILALESENYKRLRAISITPKGDVVQITGANDNGKTSLLDSIFAALDHVRVDAPMPIRAGEKKARILVTLGDRKAELLVERTFTDKGSYLKVESPDGAQFKSPQKVLDAMLGALSFDPLEFSRMKPREQYDVLKQTVKLEVDVEALEAQNRGDYDRRTEVNREIKARRAGAEAVIVPADPGEPIDEKAILDMIEGAAKRNSDIERVRTGRAALRDKAARHRVRAGELVAEAARLRAEADGKQKAADDAVATAVSLEREVNEGPPLPELVDVSQERAGLERAQAHNRSVADRKAALERRRSAFAEVEALEAKEKELTETIVGREQAKASAIAAAKMPVEGLGFGDGMVTYKDVPFVQASSAVKTRVSLMIAMAANPKIRVIRIQDGSLLDDRSMEIIAQMSRENGYQVWVEKVDTSGKVGFYIEDGSVKAIDGDLVQQASR